MQEMQVPSLGWEDPQEKEMAARSSILAENSMDRGAWRATVQGLLTVRHDQVTEHKCHKSIKPRILKNPKYKKHD